MSTRLTWKELEARTFTPEQLAVIAADVKVLAAELRRSQRQQSLAQAADDAELPMRVSDSESDDR